MLDSEAWRRELRTMAYMVIVMIIALLESRHVTLIDDTSTLLPLAKSAARTNSICKISTCNSRAYITPVIILQPCLSALVFCKCQVAGAAMSLVASSRSHCSQPNHHACPTFQLSNSKPFSVAVKALLPL